MRSPCVTPAIVLRSWPFGESDKIVSFLTEGHGKVTGIAKGAARSRRRFVNTLEPFSLVNLRFQDRPHSTLAFVQACDPIRFFKELTASLERIAYASYLVEIADGLAGEREENRKLFGHLREGLVFIEENRPSLSFLTFFELRLLKLSGYQPVLEHCRRCARDFRENAQRGWSFSTRDGGVLCGSCSTLRREIIPLSGAALQALLELQRAGSILPQHRSLSPVLKESRPALLRFLQYQARKELKSAFFLDDFL
ncbi:MAG: DNA repair protein RecO [Deltaproteobacteria bacterium]|nr:DNA repair protein RecO [Deltaproteobacteria bacterium]